MISAANRNIAIGRLEAGELQSAVARHFNVSQSTISRLYHRFLQTNSTQDRPRSGCPRVTTDAEDRYIRVLHLRHRFASIELSEIVCVRLGFALEDQLSALF